MFAALLAAAFAAAYPGVSGAANSSAGGFTVPKPAKISDVICLSGCTGLRASSPGGNIQITGSGLAAVESVSFRGDSGRIKVTPKSQSATRIESKVPNGAASGKLRVISAGGTASDFSEDRLEVGPAPTGNGAALTITDATASPVKAYQYGKKKPKLTFVLTGGKESNDLRVDISTDSGEVVTTRILRGVASGSTESVRWNGKTSSGKVARNGAYRFVVRSIDGTKAKLSSKLARTRKKAQRSSSTTDPFAFRMFGFIFPLRGAHSYGDSIGAGRGHQGQDVMANCGRPLVAARGGVVYYNEYQAGGAGNYLVINIAGPGNKSHVYMHMPSKSPLKVGTKVKTGQRVGSVGSTGRSSACHLHFEIWSSPGWYQGGTFTNPTGPLKRWDKYS